MKKITTVLLAFLLLVSTSGLSLNVHFCGEDVAGIGLTYTPRQSSAEDEGCCIEKAKEGKSCCTEKHVKIKSKIDQIAKSDLSAKHIAVLPAESPSIWVRVEIAVPGTSRHFYECAPHAPPLYKLYHQLIFYA